MSENEIILKALVEYEKNNYMNYDDEWQQKINDLIGKYKEN